MKKGKFIVICGTDGSGKGTQCTLLYDRLRKAGYKVKLTDFPQYEKPSSALVIEYLNGRFGTADEVGPYRASMFFACDRYGASHDMKKWLDEGGHIISNRYVSANKGHQLAKIRDPQERQKFLKWLDELEYGLFEIPKEDLNILLYVPPEIGQKLVEQKVAREYIGKNKDIHEADLGHLRAAAEAYRFVATQEHWMIIDCTKNGELMPIDTIHDKIYEQVIQILGKPEIQTLLQFC